MKKLLLGAGAIVAVATPIGTVVACGDDDKTVATDLVADLAKFKNQEISTTKDRTAFAEIFKTLKVGDEISEDQLGFTSVVLSQGVTAVFTITKAYDNTAGYVELEVTLKKGTEKVINNSKKIQVFTNDHVTIDLKTELDKVSDNYNSIYTAAQLVDKLKHKYDITQDDLGIKIEGLDPTTVINLYLLTPYDGKKDELDVEIFLSKSGETAPQGYEQNSKTLNIISKNV